MPDRLAKPVRRVLAIAALLALGGCVATSPARLTLIERTAPTGATYRLATPADADPRPAAAAARFTQALEQALAARGMRRDASSPAELVVAFASHPATLGVTPDRQEPEGGINWLSAPRRDRPLDQCRPERVQVSVLGPGLRIRGEFEDCGPLSPGIEALAREFAQAIAG